MIHKSGDIRWASEAMLSYSGSIVAGETPCCVIKSHQVISVAIEKSIHEVRAPDATETGLHKTRKNVVTQDRVCEPQLLKQEITLDLYFRGFISRNYIDTTSLQICF